GMVAPLSSQLSISELDALKYQIAQCWVVPAGAKYAEDLAVEIRIKLNRDGTLNQAGVVNTARYNRDTAFRAAADSAMRALRNPACSPLKLPADKYDRWKETLMNFDPREML
nr:energy transducer TonB [Micavibrio sp.]